MHARLNILAGQGRSHGDSKHLLGVNVYYKVLGTALKAAMTLYQQPLLATQICECPRGNQKKIFLL